METPKIEAKDGYVLIDLQTGYEASPSEPKAILQRISESFEPGQDRKVLIVGKAVRSNLSITDLFQRSEWLGDLKWQIAIVVTHDAPADKVQFMEDIMTLKRSKLKFFDTVEAAKDWLGVAKHEDAH